MKYIVYIAFLTIIMTGCVKTRVTKHSRNIEESKKIGVFVKEYVFSEKRIKTESMQFDVVGEAWIENQWYYKNQFREIVIEDNPVFLVSIDSVMNRGSMLDLLFFFTTDSTCFVEGTYSQGVTGTEENIKVLMRFHEYPDTIKFDFPNNQQVEFIRK